MGVTVVNSPKGRLSLTALSRYYILEAHAIALEAQAREATEGQDELLRDAIAARGAMLELLKEES